LYGVSAPTVSEAALIRIIKSAASPEGGLLALNGKSINHAFAKFETLGICTKLDDFGNLFTRVAFGLHDQAAGNNEKEVPRRILIHTGPRGL
jgi:hypothetical protein